MRYKLTFFLYRKYLVHRCGGASGESKDSLISYCVVSCTTWDYLAHNVTCAVWRRSEPVGTAFHTFLLMISSYDFLLFFFFSFG